MSQIGNYPFVRIVISFAAGIVLWNNNASWYATNLVFGIFAILMCIYTLLVFKIVRAPSFRNRFIHGVVIIPAIFCAGYLCSILRDPIEGNEGQFLLDAQCDSLPGAFAVVASEPEKKDKTYSVVLQVFASHIAECVMDGSWKAMAWMEPDDFVRGLSPGDTIFFKARWSEVQNSGNPASFDYKTYLKRKGIAATVYLSSNAWVTTGWASEKGVKWWMTKIRRGIVKSLLYSQLHEENKGLSLALLTGVKDELNDDVNQSFTTAGAVHVLCVSGLHVGIIFLLINGLFGYLQRFRKYGKILFVTLSLLAIWGYALVTGLPPSVNRAAIMFSFILLGKLFKRKNKTLNSVAASAFILLCQNPNILFHIGFQLSYLAVIGIITLHPFLTSLWVPGNKILIKIRDILFISVCAQLFTFPLTVSLFGTFPNYFLLTNLLVIPITSLVIFSGIFFLAVPIVALKPLALWVFDSLLSTMRFFVVCVEKIPGSSSDGLYLSSAQVWILLIAILGFTLWCNAHGKYWLIFSLILLLSSITMWMGDKYLLHNQKVIVVYNIRNGSLVDLIEGDRRTTIKKELAIKQKDEAFAANALRLKSGVYKLKNAMDKFDLEENKLVFISFEKFNMLIANAMIPDKIDVEAGMVLITGAIKPSEKIFLMKSVKMVIIDGSVKPYYIDQWLALGLKYGVKVWNTSIDGAYVSDQI